MKSISATVRTSHCRRTHHARTMISLRSVAAACAFMYLAPSAAYSITPSHPRTHPKFYHDIQEVSRVGKVAVMSLAADDDAYDSEWLSEVSDKADAPETKDKSWEREMASLAARLQPVRKQHELAIRLESLTSIWVLVFEAGTDDEAVYSMELDGRSSDDAHVVLAFEDMMDAKRYSLSLKEEPYALPPTVQELDFEAVVVTARDAGFDVAVVFKVDDT